MMYFIAIMYMSANYGAVPMTINIVEVRSKLADTINRVVYQGERVVVERRGKGVAVLVSMEDLQSLERMEDERLGAEALKAEARAKASGEKPIPFTEVEKEIIASRRRGRRPR
ncbi:MAG: type II toxin-antitoxin system Phd/YefM family antitoxin [Tepidisphaeraceae bacterium]|jgi:prevent-host-death family protein